ncbi:hypothetical protein HCN44_001346 [Aphidius gifuensis]|uniref:DNA polymerase subunit gamma-2, mitochondrial n=1 Tax=Aphidius gifuensis TaxID=684658 RepID=A0A834XVH1_APHGI|nr:DNA polymerase subunit gamma-2, mitochondrial-like [Aphidius gifuensis]KAF7994213.1 hypothetical protein HCN44_001346 [Aphidius gifuensis]
MIIKNIINNIGSSFLKLDKKFIYGFNGELLCRHMEKLWFNKCITMPAYNVTYLRTSDNINDTLNDIKKFGIINKPLGIGVIEETKNLWNHDIIEPTKSLVHKTGKVTIITDSSDGKNLYHKLQRERKIWWRKLSREPSRFKLTEVKKIKTTIDSVEIKAHFPFGSILVETINYQQEPRKFFSKIEAPYPECQIIEHETSFDWGCLSFICDAYTNLDDDEKFQLKFNPKLAPYKVGICIEKNPDNDDKFNEKLKLLKYLNNKLKLESIETITTNDNEQLENFHVPIIVKIDDSSFDNGIVKVWSQSTTIYELVHLSDLTRHVISRCT